MPSTMLSTSKQHITVVVVDDHNLIQEAVANILGKHENIELVAKGSVGDHVIPLVAQHLPDVLILDINMPQSEESGSRAERFAILPMIAHLAKKYPQTAVIILTQHMFPTVIHKAVEYGVNGYILKSDNVSLNLATAVNTVSRGGVYYSPTILEELRRNQNGLPAISLTKRQLEVLAITQRYPNASYYENARRLGIKESTFKTHLHTAFTLLDARNATAAILQCQKLGLLPPHT